MIWLRPEQCIPPHGVTHPEKLGSLISSIREEGWKRGEPVLLGYPWEERVQLVSGSHRHAACSVLEHPLPVLVRPYEFWLSIWGSDAWVELLSDPPRLV